MAARQAKGLNVHKQFKPKTTTPALADGTMYTAGMRVRLDGTDERGTIAWVVREKDDSGWTAVVSWDGARSIFFRPQTPRAKQSLRKLIAA